MAFKNEGDWVLPNMDEWTRNDNDQTWLFCPATSDPNARFDIEEFLSSRPRDSNHNRLYQLIVEEEHFREGGGDASRASASQFKKPLENEKREKKRTSEEPRAGSLMDDSLATIDVSPIENYKPSPDAMVGAGNKIPESTPISSYATGETRGPPETRVIWPSRVEQHDKAKSKPHVRWNDRTVYYDPINSPESDKLNSTYSVSESEIFGTAKDRKTPQGWDEKEGQPEARVISPSGVEKDFEPNSTLFHEAIVSPESDKLNSTFSVSESEIFGTAKDRKTPQGWDEKEDQPETQVISGVEQNDKSISTVFHDCDRSVYYDVIASPKSDRLNSTYTLSESDIFGTSKDSKIPHGWDEKGASNQAGISKTLSEPSLLSIAGPSRLFPPSSEIPTCSGSSRDVREGFSAKGLGKATSNEDQKKNPKVFVSRVPRRSRIPKMADKNVSGKSPKK